MARRRSSLTNIAKALRQQENRPEARLWAALRNRKLGHKFRRQLPIGNYVADFACVELRLVIELDGSQYVDRPGDQVRDQFMADAGWSVARFPSGQMLTKPDEIVATILAICEGSYCATVRDHDFVFLPAKNPSSGASRHLLPSSGEKWEGADFMRRAIALAQAQFGRTEPNPPVGCVIVKDGVFIAEGATGDGGRPHAEEIALDAAGEAARGATAYVTLEPCGERSNGTCSCGQRLVEAGVGRVVYACDDPSPYASHKGPNRLIAAAIPIEKGLLADEASALIQPFVERLRSEGLIR